MGRETLKIVLSLLGAGVLALCVLVVAILLSGHPRGRGAELFRFQLGSMLAMAVFTGVAIVIYARLSRYEPRGRRKPGNARGWRAASESRRKSESKDRQ